ncbi:pyruvate formate-lyase-activating protein [Virgibacillus sediminis]|uniref:Pyruvate formate-lyase-activating enzyme n=1 Tax=Virgibacillus sediminis TaxID=202260 RepID=A0ABV7A2Z0_9BACI
MKDRLHTIQTCTKEHGPGLRYLLVMQGCPMRCRSCHQPDSRRISEGREITVEEIVQEVTTYLPFLQASGGGITVSGGEALLHTKFLNKLFSEMKKLGVHTAIDTAGGCYTKSDFFMKQLDQLLSNTDLVLLNLKQIDPDKHRAHTGITNSHILEFARHLSDRNVPVWIRHELIEGVSDHDEDLILLSDFIHTLKNVEKVEVLPYLNGDKPGYQLEGMKTPTAARLSNAEQILNHQII